MGGSFVENNYHWIFYDHKKASLPTHYILYLMLYTENRIHNFSIFQLEAFRTKNYLKEVNYVKWKDFVTI